MKRCVSPMTAFAASIILPLVTSSQTVAAANPAAPSNVCVQDSTGPSACSNLSVPGALSKKWHPGHYVRPGGAQGFKSEWDQRRQIYDILKEEPRFVGANMQVPWGLVETSKGVYDFSQIDADLAYVKSMGKRLIIELTLEWFNLSKSSTERYFPQYLVDEGGVIDAAEGSGSSSGHFYRTNFDLPWVMDRLVALHAALAARYDKDPNIELITFGETAAVKCSQWTSGIQKIGALWPNTNVVLPMNFCDVTPGPLLAAAVASGVGVGGPDTRIPSMGEDHGSRALRGVGIDSWYKNPDAGGSTDFGTHDYRGEIPVAYEYEALANVPPASLIDYITDTLRATHYMWATYKNSWHPDWCGPNPELCYEDGILKTLKSVNFQINSACPTIYKGGCKTE